MLIKKIILWVVMTLFWIFIFYPNEKELSTKRFIFEKSYSYNSGIPFNYFLIDKNQNSIIYFFVNDYIEEGSFIYFSYIDGGIAHDFCYTNKKLKLLRINKLTDSIENAQINKHQIVFDKINKIKYSDLTWLQSEYNRCK